MNGKKSIFFSIWFCVVIEVGHCILYMQRKCAIGGFVKVVFCNLSIVLKIIALTMLCNEKKEKKITKHLHYIDPNLHLINSAKWKLHWMFYSITTMNPFRNKMISNDFACIFPSMFIIYFSAQQRQTQHYTQNIKRKTKSIRNNNKNSV